MEVYGVIRDILLMKCGEKVNDECICMAESMTKLELNNIDESL
jgi:hypothetical protein